MARRAPDGFAWWTFPGEIDFPRSSGRYHVDKTELLAAINLLAQGLEHQPDDLHEVHFKVKELLDELRSTGMPLPDDLVEFEKYLTKRVDGEPK